jgi:hypothetical protein
MVKNWQNLESSGNPVVDAVATVVYARRQQKLPLKSLSLSLRCYSRFEQWVLAQQAKIGENGFIGQKLCFDGVDIECSAVQSKDILEDYYPMNLQKMP